MINKKLMKSFSVLLSMAMLNQIFFPTYMLAVTGGPSQPELESFTPFDSSNMVDIFSGDFKYNIPLLNVPGPNGGYPINLAYSGGVGVDQEASWVGLGWNLNPGAINRQLRGLPDDFDGSQQVTRDRKMKPNRTYSIGLGTAFSEVFGFDLSKISDDLSLSANLNLTMNNYTGFDMGLGFGFSTIEDKNNQPSDVPKKENAAEDKKPDTNKSFAGLTKGKIVSQAKEKRFYTGANIANQYKSALIRTGINSLGKIPASAYFAGQNNSLSSIDFPRKSNSFTFDGKIGVDIFTVTTDLEYTLFYSQQDYKESSISYPAYGYIHSEAGSKNDGAIMDYYTDKSSQLNPSSAYLPVPILTNDVYSVSGQGVAGTYRPQLSTIPVLATPTVESASDSYGFGLDLAGSSSNIKFGVNPRASFTKGKSGRWTSGDADLAYFREDLNLSATDAVTYEKSPFIKLGGLTDNLWHEEKMLAEPYALHFGMNTEFHGLSVKPKVFSQVYQENKNSSYTVSKPDRIREKRPARSNLFKYYSGKDLRNIFNDDEHPYRDIATIANMQAANILHESNLDVDPLSFTDNALIHQIAVENQGYDYVYGIPVFTNSKVDKTFSISAEDITASKGKVIFDADDDTENNEKGRGALYNANKVSAFAHAYLLTEVLSDDYVDITNNGPTEDDFGSYTKFDYVRAYENFASRAPASPDGGNERTASFVPGSSSDQEDDMASYSESKKEIYYLRKIETKTHVAEFELEKRTDDYGHIPGSAKQELAKLTKITLYKKLPGNQKEEIKAVEFEYHASTAGDKGLMHNAPMAPNGKLTLKNIRFTFEGQTTGTYLNPYEFEYNLRSYEAGSTNKWGNFQPNAENDFGSNFLYPYVAQNRDLDDDKITLGDEEDDKAVRDAWASSWQLKKIKLPTGGEIEVNYEQDDYQYVQDRKAASMYKIVGIGSTTGVSLNSNRIYFELKEEVPTSLTSEELDDYGDDLTDGVENVYFKALVNLKESSTYQGGPLKQGDMVSDFVEGYLNFANIDFDSSCINPATSHYRYAYITVESASGGKNAMRLAAAHFLRLNGQHLNSSFSVDFTGVQSESNLTKIVSSVVKGAMADKDQNKDFIAAAFGVKNYCNSISTTEASLIRLNAQGKRKYGGGSRVKELILKNNWDLMHGTESTFNMKQVYRYVNADGTSSGVAEYEPLMGGEENPFRQPYYYSNDRAFFNDKALLFELPATEALYPSGRVGYERVEMESIPVDTSGNEIPNYSLSSNGIQVHEFYTAKDYPVRSSATQAKKVNMSEVVSFTKWIGGENFFQPGFSQGYYTELNDMHGKQKSVSQYSKTIGTSGAPFQSTKYYYRTQGGYSPDKANRLENTVDVLLADGQIESKTIGQSSEAYMEMVESQSKTKGGAIKFNGDFLVIGVIPIPLPSAVPSIDYSFSLKRTAVMNKLVSKTAIMEKVVTQKEGRTTTVNNLLFDYETGSPLLTQTNNDYNKPIYTYNRPEHWVNDQFQLPYRNWGAVVNGSNYQGVIQNGDMIVDDSGNFFWVESASGGLLRNSSGASIHINSAFVNGTIIESGYTGKTGVMSSQIVSLEDPSNADNRDFILFDLYNDKNSWLSTFSEINGDFQPFHSCDPPIQNACSGAEICAWIREEGGTLFFAEKDDLSEFATITFPANYSVADMAQFHLQKLGTQIKATLGNTVLYLDWNDPNNVFPDCLPGVLDASVSLYEDDHKNYEVLSNYPALSQTNINNNTARYKSRFDYKMVEGLKSIVKRTHTDVMATAGFFETKLQEDGSYDKFQDYNFSADVVENNMWISTGITSKYDPFGNALENENALGIYSAELMNDDHTLVSATANNASYGEIAYQSFEDQNGTFTGIHGHMEFSSNQSIVNEAHTGEKALRMLNNAELTLDSLEMGKVYRISFWKKKEVGTANITGGSNTSIRVDAKNVDGWDLITYTFEADDTSIDFGFSPTMTIDDIRAYPADAFIKTFVYDVDTYRLIAELDANNFATLYGYNEEGVLSQVKKETDRGVHTVSNYIVHHNK